MSLPSEAPRSSSDATAAERILSLVSRQGRAGITQAELLRTLGVGYDDLVVALESLQSQGLIRIHRPTPDVVRVFYTG